MYIWKREDFASSTNKMKIFIEAMHGMGDVVCMLPMFREVRENWPDSQITVLVQNKGIMDVVRLSGLNIDRIIGINAHLNKFEFLKMLLKLRREKFDLSISAAGTPLFKARLVSWIVGAKKQAGIRFDKKKFASYGSPENYHFVDFNLLILEQLGITNHHYNPQLIPDPQDVAKFVNVIDRSRPVIGVLIGRADAWQNNRTKISKLYPREWGGGIRHITHIATLIKLLLAQNWQVVLIGGKQELEVHDALSPELLNECIDYVGKTSVAESIALVSLCNVSVGIDTGMQHIADAVGIKTVSIFGTTNPKTHGAYSDKAVFAEVDEPCKYCYDPYNLHLYLYCEHRRCLDRITPEQVLKLIALQLNE